MTSRKKPDNDSGVFGLEKPTGEVGPVKSALASAPAELPRHPENIPDDPSLRLGGWKGLEEDDGDDGDDDDKVSFGGGQFRSEGDLDMTPMVDVTFLLLIFFMVTASFSLMRSLQQPPPDTEQPSTTVVEPDEEDNKDYVEVFIDQNNSFFVTNRGEEEIEAPSETEMRALVRNAKNDFGTEKLLVTAHVDSMHSKYVAVWDAGRAAGMTEIKSRTTEEEY